MKNLHRLLSLGVLIGLGAANAQSETINIGLGYIPNVQFTPFYVADKLGYFKREGIKVNYQHGYVPQLLPLLLNGKLDFVVGDAEDSVFAKNQGGNTIYIMTMYQKNPTAIFSLEPLSNIKDLKNKTIGIPAPFGTSYYALQALIDSAKFSKKDTPTLLNIGYTQIDAVRAGRVDAAVGYINNEVTLLESIGKKVYSISTSDVYPMVGVGVFTHKDKVDAAITKKVIRAIQRGIKYTIDNPKEAFKISKPIFGSSGTLDILKASIPLMSSPTTKNLGLGANNSSNWNKAIKVLISQGKLPSTANSTSFYTNQFIDKNIK